MKAAYEKILETFRLKVVYDQMELQDFKQLINVLETEEEFIAKNLTRYTQVSAPGNFLEQILERALERFDFGIVKRVKEEKVLSFLERTHDYILKN